MQYLHGLADWLPPQAGMFMWLKLGAAIKDADDIIDTLREEKVGVVPGMPLPVLHGNSLELLALRQDLGLHQMLLMYAVFAWKQWPVVLAYS